MSHEIDHQSPMMKTLLLISLIVLLSSFNIAVFGLRNSHHQRIIRPASSTPLSKASLLSGVRNPTRPTSNLFSTTGNTNIFVSEYHEFSMHTLKGIHLFDITPQIRDAIKASNVTAGTATVVAKHTTTALTINEMEPRLVDDIRQFLPKLVPPDYPYLHNDIHLRNAPPDWPGGDAAWRAQEPVNCHSHLISMLLGTTECIPIHKADLMLGTWQSVILASLHYYFSLCLFN